MKEGLSVADNRTSGLHIQLLGGFVVLVDGTPIPDGQWKSGRARNLVKLLALAPSHRLHRDQVLDAFWPDSQPTAAINSLHQTLYTARRILEPLAPGCLTLEEGFLSLSGGKGQILSVDVEQFETSATQAKNSQSLEACQAALALYTGDLLPEDRYEDWTFRQREALQQIFLQLLLSLAHLQETYRDYPVGIEALQRLLAIDPCHEEAHTGLMRLYALSGQRQQALRQYQDLREVLQTELVAEPGLAAQKLYQAIQSGQFGEPMPAPLPGVPVHRHNLPAQLTSFIGREKDIAEVKRLIRDHRLITLTGPGGTGKTRLALHIAGDMVDEYEDGVWLVELAPISDPTLVPAVTARALGLRELAVSQMISLLQEYLENRQLLLILDNCEHVIEACVNLTDRLLKSCPKLSLLVSSRESLGITGEVTFHLSPLSLPADDQSLPIEALRQYEAIRLFVERAAAASPGFHLTSTNASAVIQVCRRLDGIPLAIELAASRVRLLQVAEIAQCLNDRFRLLTGGSRAALPRYQTLRASIDWSYDLLTPLERTFLQRLSVFTGGWALEAAESVGCGEEIQASDMLELLGHLVDKSLVNPGVGTGCETRYSMLETIRQYAHEKMVEAGQAAGARQSHLQYFLELAEQVGGKIRGPDQAHILERLEAELDNLRQALAWSLDGKGAPGWNPEPGLRLASALKWFWHCRGRQDEGLHWLELLLEGEAEELADRPRTPERTRCRARALEVAAWSAAMIEKFTETSRFATECQELYQSLGPDGRIGYAYVRLASFNFITNPADAARLLDECQGIFQEAGDRFGIAECILFLAHLAHYYKDFDNAKRCFEESLNIRKEIGDLDGAGCALANLGELAYNDGRIEQGRALVEESLRLFSKIHNDAFLGLIHHILGLFDCVEGNYPQAAAQFTETLSIGRRHGDVNLIQTGLLNLGELALIQENTLGAAAKFEEGLTYFRKRDHKCYIAHFLYYSGLLAWTMGAFDQASRMYTEALATYRADERTDHVARVLCELGKVALAQGEISQAQTQLDQALMTKSPAHIYYWENREPVMLTMEAIAILAAAQRQMEGAVLLLGITETWHERFYYSRTHRERQEREACIVSLRSMMSEQIFNTTFAKGQAMTQEQASQVAKEILSALWGGSDHQR